MSPQDFGEGPLEEHLVAPGSPHHLDAVAHHGGRFARYLGGTDADLQTGRCPPAGHLVEMEFGAPSFVIVEVAPGEYVNTSDVRSVNQ
jgi:hypothetical protein